MIYHVINAQLNKKQGVKWDTSTDLFTSKMMFPYIVIICATVLFMRMTTKGLSEYLKGSYQLLSPGKKPWAIHIYQFNSFVAFWFFLLKINIHFLEVSYCSSLIIAWKDMHSESLFQTDPFVIHFDSY